MRANLEGIRASQLPLLASFAASAILVAACSGSGAGPSAAIQSGAPEPAASESSSGGGRGDYGYETGAEASPASAVPGPTAVQVNTASGGVGTWLTGADGLTLYTFKPDSANSSTCLDDCAQAWPPLTVGSDGSVEAGDGVGGELTTFARPDGSLQVAYNGAPLYYFASDTAPGDTNGEGIEGNWFVAAP